MSNALQTLVDRILARFALIKIADGYQTNLGLALKEWQTTPVDDTELTEKPAILLVRDFVATRQPDKDGENSSRHTWKTQIVVDAVLQESAQSPVEGRKALSDLRKAVGVDPTWGGLARRSEESSEKLMLDKEGGNVAGVQLIFYVVTSRKPWEP